MRDLNDIFMEKLTLMQKLSSELNFHACSRISTDLISVSSMLDYKDGVFVGEVLEAMFDQLRRLLVDFELDEKDQNILKENFVKNLELVSQTFTKSDKNQIYTALSNLRFEATQLQYKCFHTLKRKENRHRFE